MTVHENVWVFTCQRHIVHDFAEIKKLQPVKEIYKPEHATPIEVIEHATP